MFNVLIIMAFLHPVRTPTKKNSLCVVSSLLFSSLSLPLSFISSPSTSRRSMTVCFLSDTPHGASAPAGHRSLGLVTGPELYKLATFVASSFYSYVCSFLLLWSGCLDLANVWYNYTLTNMLTWKWMGGGRALNSWCHLIFHVSVFAGVAYPT